MKTGVKKLTINVVVVGLLVLYFFGMLQLFSVLEAKEKVDEIDKRKELAVMFVKLLVNGYASESEYNYYSKILSYDMIGEFLTKEGTNEYNLEIKSVKLSRDNNVLVKYSTNRGDQKCIVSIKDDIVVGYRSLN